MTLNKAEITTRICEKHGFSRNDATRMVDAVFEIIKASLERSEDVKITNFGNFAVRTKNARKVHNPKTGAEIIIPSRKVLTFRPSAATKKTVNELTSE